MVRYWTKREDIRRVTTGRFGDDTLAARAADVDKGLLDEALDAVVAAATADDVIRWLQRIGA